MASNDNTHLNVQWIANFSKGCWLCQNNEIDSTYYSYLMHIEIRR